MPPLPNDAHLMYNSGTRWTTVEVARGPDEVVVSFESGSDDGGSSDGASEGWSGRIVLDAATGRWRSVAAESDRTWLEQEARPELLSRLIDPSPRPITTRFDRLSSAEDASFHLATFALFSGMSALEIRESFSRSIVDAVLTTDREGALSLHLEYVDERTGAVEVLDATIFSDAPFPAWTSAGWTLVRNASVWAGEPSNEWGPERLGAPETCSEVGAWTRFPPLGGGFDVTPDEMVRALESSERYRDFVAEHPDAFAVELHHVADRSATGSLMQHHSWYGVISAAPSPEHRADLFRFKVTRDASGEAGLAVEEVQRNVSAAWQHPGPSGAMDLLEDDDGRAMAFLWSLRRSPFDDRPVVAMRPEAADDQEASAHVEHWFDGTTGCEVARARFTMYEGNL